MTALDITCLRSLITVASLGGVRRAAEALRLPQPTVTGHVRRLEMDLGFAIVFRQGRSIAFTARGEDVLREAYALVAAHDSALGRLGADARNELVIASTEHASELTVQGIARVLGQAYPQHRVRYEFHRTARIREFVHHRAAAVAVGFGDLGRGVVHVADVPLSWVGGYGSTGLDQPIVAFTPPCVIRDRMLAVSPERPIARQCVDLMSLTAAVRAGVGITALPERADLPSGLVRVDGMPTLTRVPLSLVTASGVSAQVRNAIRRELAHSWAAA